MKDQVICRKLRTAYSNQERLFPREVREEKADHAEPKKPVFNPQTMQFLSSSR